MFSTYCLPCPFLLRLCLLMLLAGLLACNAKKAAPQTAAAGPRVLDARLTLTPFAENPDIVTPIGIAVDSFDRLYVLESHTHLPPKDYLGPAGDVIKRFVDENSDGTPDGISVFAKGFKEGMNLAFSPAGHLYLVTSRAVWVLYDRDGDGVSEERLKVMELSEPKKVYAHAALLGITFSSDGWMYVSRGNTGSAAWKLVGTDGSAVSGYGDGGNIVRARPDGTKLEEVATGFWNPVDLKFDRHGHLLACDNDPDSRGPNRLVHVVTGGDYGYQSLYGGSGIHPYLAWNGELPGTLPYAVGLGEAPSGLLDATQGALPEDYAGQMLCTIWEESRIVRIKLSPKGVSLAGSTEVIVEGDEQFRPVAFAAGRNGTVYITDWVLRDYPNHGKGRIWRLAAKPGVPVLKPRRPDAPPVPDAQEKPLLDTGRAGTPAHFARLTDALRSDDAFLRHAAIMALAGPAYRPQALAATTDKDPAVRLGALLALQRSEYKGAGPLVRRMLADPDVQVRQRALIWAGKSGLSSLRPHLDRALTAGPVPPATFETYLETISHLDPAFIAAYRNRSQTYSKTIERRLPAGFFESFIGDLSRPAALRALALPHLEPSADHVKLLTSIIAGEKNPQLRLEAVRSLADIPDERVAQQLLELAAGPANPVPIRAEALLSLSRQPLADVTGVLPLLRDPEADIRLETARYLRSRIGDEGVRQALQHLYDSLAGGQDDSLKEQLALALFPEKQRRPQSVDAWQPLLATGGDPARGRRVLYSVQSMCSVCHAVAGRGGDLGPELSNVGKSKTRSQLVHAILRPSEEISPEYQGWYLKLKNSELLQGRQIDVGNDSIELYTPEKGFITVAKKVVADYGMSETSLMPDGLEQQLTESDLRDLIAFLEAKDYWEAAPGRSLTREPPKH